MATTGSLPINSENIFPIIKKWLYSDHDIFIRELVSNGCDAITKYKMLHPGMEEDMSVTVEVDKEQKQIRISDTGIGMTADEVRQLRFVNQDGTVNQLDITRAQRTYGTVEGDANWNPLADVNHDGVVDINDLILILNNYSK